MTTSQTLPAELLDSLMSDYKSPEDLIGEHGLLKQLTKALVERFGKLGLANALIIGGAEIEANFQRAARNIPNIDVLPNAGLNVYDVLRRQTLVLTKDAVEAINARFAEKEAA